MRRDCTKHSQQKPRKKKRSKKGIFFTSLVKCESLIRASVDSVKELVATVIKKALVKQKAFNFI